MPRRAFKCPLGASNAPSGMFKCPHQCSNTLGVQNASQFFIENLFHFHDF